MIHSLLKKLLPLILIVAALTAELLSQTEFSPNEIQLRFERISSEDGLSHSSIHWIHQDKTGYIWISTPDGLNRFDGYTFRTFRYDPSDSTTIRGSWAGSLYERANGELWIAMGVGGYNRFQPETETFTHFGFDSLNVNSLPSNLVLTIHEDSNKRLWVGTNKGIAYFDDATTSFIRPTNLIPDTGIIHSIVEDSLGYVWIASYSKIYRYSTRSKKIERVNLQEHWPGETAPVLISSLASAKDGVWSAISGRGFLKLTSVEDHLNAVAFMPISGNESSLSAPHLMREDKEGHLWVAVKGGGVNRLEPQSGAIYRYRKASGDLTDNLINFIWEDRTGTMWIGTANGLNRMSPQERKFNRFSHYTHDPADQYSLSYHAMSMVHEDRNGMLWFGTMGGGISRLSPNKAQFGHLRFGRHLPNTVAAKNIRSILITEDSTTAKQDLWLATSGSGLIRISEPVSFDSEKQIVESSFSHSPGNRNSIDHNVVQTLLEDNLGMIWIGTRAGVNRLDPVSNRVERINFSKHYNPRNLPISVYILFQDKDNMIWIGTQNNGLTRLDPKTGATKTFTTENSNLGANTIWDLMQEPSGTIWIGTAVGGLSRLEPETEAIRTYLPIKGDPYSLNNRSITSLHLDKSGTIWLGTFSGGLNRYLPQHDGFQNVMIKDGLPNNTIQGILEDADGRLWLTSNKGLTLFNPDGGVRNFTVRDGLQANEFNRGAYAMSSSGQLLFGGINGINRFFPDSLRLEAQNAPVQITGLQTFGKEAKLNSPLNRCDTLNFSYDENLFTLDFALLEFSGSQENKYAYKLKGLNEFWIDLGTRRSVTFTNLNPGSYTFLVKGSNRDGSWSSEETALTIIVHPPFWRTWWFRGLVIFSLIFLIGLLYRYRVRHLRKQQQLLAEEVEKQTRELRLQKKELEKTNLQKNEFVGIAAHDLRNPLTGIIGYLELLIQQVRSGVFDPKAGLEQLEFLMTTARRMSALITEMLNVAAIESGTMQLNLKSDDLGELLKKMTNFYSQAAIRKDISLRFIETSHIPAFNFDNARITEVLENLLSNAIKYTHHGGEVIVSYTCEEGAIIVCVKDNGQGLSSEDQQYVFQSFRKLSARPTGGESSSGLGLAIVKKLVELHKGKIWVESKKGEGAAFYMKLPLNRSPLNTERRLKRKKQLN
ncbi:MAG: two-component regulator propeller domain-containing protein [Calditrichia bacterium]